MITGTWSNAGAVFTIENDYTFYCDLTTVNPHFLMPARVRGKLNHDARGLGPDDYLAENITVHDNGNPEKFEAGNAVIKFAVESFSGVLIVTLTLNADQTQFTLTANDPAAERFFSAAGPYSRQS